jgi:hypothetical protein
MIIMNTGCKIRSAIYLSSRVFGASSKKSISAIFSAANLVLFPSQGSTRLMTYHAPRHRPHKTALYGDKEEEEEDDARPRSDAYFSGGGRCLSTYYVEAK